jgi:hypothetical protein
MAKHHAGIDSPLHPLLLLLLTPLPPFPSRPRHVPQAARHATLHPQAKPIQFPDVSSRHCYRSPVREVRLSPPSSAHAPRSLLPLPLHRAPVTLVQVRRQMRHLRQLRQAVHAGETYASKALCHALTHARVRIRVYHLMYLHSYTRCMLQSSFILCRAGAHLRRVQLRQLRGQVGPSSRALPSSPGCFTQRFSLSLLGLSHVLQMRDLRGARRE